MTRRYILLTTLCSLLITGLIYYWVILSSAMSKQERLVRRIENRKADLVQMKALKNEWEGFQKRRREAERRLRQKGKAFTLLAFLERVSRSVGIEKKIQYMKPLSLPHDEGVLKPEGIEIGLDRVNMRELVSFLHKVEYSGKLLCIKRIKIKKSSQGKTLKIVLQVTSYSST